MFSLTADNRKAKAHNGKLARYITEAVSLASVFTALSYVLSYLLDWLPPSVNWVEIFAVFASYACTWLCVRQSRYNYPIGTLGVIAYAFVFWQADLVGSAFLQVYLISQLVYGWFRWRSDDQTRPVGRVNLRWWPAYVAVTAAFYGGAYLLVTALGGGFKLIDSLILVGTILAQFLLDNKKIETWFVWAVVNIAAIYVYFHAGLPLAGFQYVLFLINTLVGFAMWRESKLDHDWLQREKRRRTTEEVFGPAKPEWTDPLNPHGDGTLRPGDPIFDATMRGNAVVGNFGPEGWKFDEKTEP